MTINYDELSRQIKDLEPQIRFAAVVNSKGELIAGGQKNSVEKILANDEINMSIHYALQKRDLYTNLAYKIGRERYSITEYEKVTMISIPINSQELFLISTEPRVDYFTIIDHVHSIFDSKKNLDNT
jgi:hypothetical protein